MAANQFNYLHMSNILKELNMGNINVLENFEREKITPDIIGKLSAQELESLGITCRSQMLLLRTHCIKYGCEPPGKIYHGAGAPKYDLPKNVIEDLKLLVVLKCVQDCTSHWS